MKRCRFCDEALAWKQRGEKWVPVNQDGTRHRCGASRWPARSAPKRLSKELVEAAIEAWAPDHEGLT